MDELHIKEITMEFNDNIIEAARLMVREIEIQEGEIYEISGYRGMCVAIADTDAAVQSGDFFTEGNRRYVVGPRVK